MFKLKILLTAIISLVFFNVSSQQLNYSISESYAIHDSINNSRWDIGGRLSHYSFRFMSEFFPAAIIHKPAISYTFPEKPMKGISDIRMVVGKDSLLFDDYLQRMHINSFIIVHKGTIIHEKYFSMKPEEQHTLMSITKVVTSTLIAQLINEGKIIVNAPIETYIAELKNTEWQGTSVKDILNMRSGMIGSETSENMGGFTNPEHPYYSFEEALGILPIVGDVKPSVFEYVASMKRKVPAGEEPEYNSMNTFILGWLAEKVTGQRLADLITEKIWKPMGASSNAYICMSDTGVPWAHGGISATLRDLARFGMYYTKTEMKANSERTISTAQMKEIFEAPQLDLGFERFQWGYQWDVAREGVMMKGGFGGQVLMIDPERDLVIAYYNHIDEDWMTINMISWNAFNKIKAVIDTKE